MPKTTWTEYDEEVARLRTTITEYGGVQRFLAYPGLSGKYSSSYKMQALFLKACEGVKQDEIDELKRQIAGLVDRSEEADHQLSLLTDPPQAVSVAA